MLIYLKKRRRIKLLGDPKCRQQTSFKYNHDEDDHDDGYLVMKVILVKEVISCDVSPVAMFMCIFLCLLCLYLGITEYFKFDENLK